LKKLSVATAVSVGRKIAFPPMKRSPVRILARRPGSSSCSIGGSRAGTRARKNAETRNETASPSSANGALKTWTRSPPSDGPATEENERLPCVSALPSRKRSRLVSATKSVG
jgi:hypothetical protein